MGYHIVQSGYSGLQQVTTCNRVVTVGYSGYSRSPRGCRGLQQFTEWLLWVTTWYQVVTVVYSRLQQVTEWLQWVTEGYSMSPMDTVG